MLFNNNEELFQIASEDGIKHLREDILQYCIILHLKIIKEVIFLQTTISKLNLIFLLKISKRYQEYFKMLLKIFILLVLNP